MGKERSTEKETRLIQFTLGRDENHAVTEIADRHNSSLVDVARAGIRVMTQLEILRENPEMMKGLSAEALFLMLNPWPTLKSRPQTPAENVVFTPPTPTQ